MFKKAVAVLFGGISPEHEVSIITGIQVMNALDKSKYDVIPVYVTKDGRWILGDESFLNPVTFKSLDTNLIRELVSFSTDPTHRGLKLESSNHLFIKKLISKKVDVAFVAFHGKYGEGGSVQGLLELADIPYTGCDVQASAIGMDKIVSKNIARGIGIPVLKDVWILKQNWLMDKNNTMSKIKNLLKFPVFVKPARLGSSIGISKVSNNKELKEALDVAFFYDSKVLVEESLENAVEINISILGNNPYQVSVCEMPVSSGGVLTFNDKYLSNKGQSKGMASTKRIVPAPIKKMTKEKIEKYARLFFGEIGGEGIARVDFLISKDEKNIYLNEVNTIPGSLAFYLWKESGTPFNKLVEALIGLGLERHEQKKKLITAFSSNILAGFNESKGVKG